MLFGAEVRVKFVSIQTTVSLLDFFDDGEEGSQTRLSDRLRRRRMYDYGVFIGRNISPVLQ